MKEGRHIVRNPAVTREKAALAKHFRRHPTATEKRAWELLRGRRCLGLKFRRQQVLHGFIVDFYCAEYRLAVELDGGIHSAQTEEDQARDEALSLDDITVLRIPNEEVSQETLKAKLKEALPTL